MADPFYSQENLLHGGAAIVLIPCLMDTGGKPSTGRDTITKWNNLIKTQLFLKSTENGIKLLLAPHHRHGERLKIQIWNSLNFPKSLMYTVYIMCTLWFDNLYRIGDDNVSSEPVQWNEDVIQKDVGVSLTDRKPQTMYRNKKQIIWLCGF